MRLTWASTSAMGSFVPEEVDIIIVGGQYLMTWLANVKVELSEVLLQHVLRTQLRHCKFCSSKPVKTIAIIPRSILLLYSLAISEKEILMSRNISPTTTKISDDAPSIGQDRFLEVDPRSMFWCTPVQQPAILMNGRLKDGPSKIWNLILRR